MKATYKTKVEAAIARGGCRIVCPITNFILTKGVSINEDNKYETTDRLQINTIIRDPEKLAEHPIQIDLLRDPIGIVVDDVESLVDYGDKKVGVGVFEGAEFDDEFFLLGMVLQETIFDEIVRRLLETEKSMHIKREVCATVIGLLSKEYEMDRKKSLCVTEFEVIVFLSENEHQK